MFNKISITGDLGSGKSTIAKILSDELGIQYLSTGKIQRNIATRYGMNTLELNKYADTHKEIDNEIDDVLRSLNMSSNSFVIDSRLGWFFIPESYKIYFLIDIEIAAKRVVNDTTRINEKYLSIQNAIQSIKERKISENNRFLHEYSADCSNLNNFDLCINTTDLKAINVSKFILEKLNKNKHNSKGIIWCNPKILLPTQNIRESFSIGREEIKKSIDLNGFDPNEPVKVIESNGSWAILDGHKRTSSSISSGIDLIPVIIIAKDDEKLEFNISVKKYFEDSINKSWIYDWEDAHEFIFYKYPFENN